VAGRGKRFERTTKDLHCGEREKLFLMGDKVAKKPATVLHPKKASVLIRQPACLQKRELEYSGTPTGGLGRNGATLPDSAPKR